MIIKKRDFYRPFEYQKAYDYYRNQQLVHWTKDEIKLAEDIQNWNKNLTDDEKEIIGGILKGFTQMEILVGDYWRNVAQWFPKPEIAMMASTFSYFESIHMDNYAMINEELGLDNFKAFLYDSSVKNKLDYFIDIDNNDTLENKAKSLAIFSAFAEGVQLFSSFAVLLSFQKENLMKGIGQVVSFSIRDENLHSEGGIWIFNILCDENKELRENIKNDIYKASNIILELETSFINNLFNKGNIRTLTKEELINFIKYRLSKKLNELGYDSNIEYDNNLLNNMNWFNLLSSGREFGDFFATRVTEYTKYDVDPNNMF